MSIKKWLNNDKISLGIVLGLIVPVPAGIVFILILRVFQNYLHILSRVRDMDMLLLGLAVNLLIMRYYLVKLKFDKTGKTIMVVTVAMILLFLIFLKNSSYVFPI